MVIDKFKMHLKKKKRLLVGTHFINKVEWMCLGAGVCTYGFLSGKLAEGNFPHFTDGMMPRPLLDGYSRLVEIYTNAMGISFTKTLYL
jgi:hypothetical protein